jgi:uncharacterized protein (TIGR02246 family)
MTAAFDTDDSLSDDDQIRALWVRLSQAWAAGSGEQFGRVFAPDADFVSVRGELQHGCVEIGDRHAGLFRSVYLDSTLVTDIQAIRYLTSDVAVVQAASTVLSPESAPSMSTHAQAVVERRGGEWTIVAFHNMVPLPQAGRPGGKST